MEKAYDVVGVGVTAFDIIVEVDRYPGADEKMEARRVVEQGGGIVGTALVAAARLGGCCAYLGALGDDAFADFSVKEFEREGIDTSHIRRVPGASVLLALIVADRSAGTRMIVWTGDRAPKLEPDEVPEGPIRRARVLHVDNYYPESALAAARIARSYDVPVTMDLEMSDESADEFLGNADYPIVPLEFVQQRYGVEEAEEGARALYEEVASHGGTAALVTAGTDGSVGVSAEGLVHQAAFAADVVDTTGCGDVYHGAFALGVAKGWSLKRCMQVAAATAALKCRKLGGRAGIPTMEDVEALLRTTSS